MHDDPPPIRRALLGCLGLAVAGLVIAGLVRPAIFFFAPARDDGVVTVGTLAEAREGPTFRDLILARSYGYDGEIDAGEGRVQLTVVLGAIPGGQVTVVSGASPVEDDCPLELGADRLVDCEGRAWTLDGLPLDSADPPLERWAVDVSGGAVVADFTHLAGE